MNGLKQVGLSAPGLVSTIILCIHIMVVETVMNVLKLLRLKLLKGKRKIIRHCYKQECYKWKHNGHQRKISDWCASSYYFSIADKYLRNHRWISETAPIYGASIH